MAARTQARKGKKHKKYIRPLTRKGSARRRKWVSVTVRSEHYEMLKELSRHYRKSDNYPMPPINKIVGTLIVADFLRVLEKINPETAKQLQEEYHDEKHIDDILDLPR